MLAVAGGFPEGHHQIAAGVPADVVMHLEAVPCEGRGDGFHQGLVARRAPPRSNDDLVVLHAPRAAGVPVNEQGVAVGGANLAQQAFEAGVVRVVIRLQAGFKLVQGERLGEDGGVADGVRAHHAAMRANRAVLRLEIVAAAVHVHKDARQRRGQYGSALLVQVGVKVADEGVGEPVGEGFKPGFAIIVGRHAGQGLGAEVGNADQDGAAGRLGISRVFDDGERLRHRASRRTGMACAPSRMSPRRGGRPRRCCHAATVRWMAFSTIGPNAFSPL